MFDSWPTSRVHTRRWPVYLDARSIEVLQLLEMDMQTMDSRLSTLIGKIYDAALAPQLWPAFLAEFAAHFDSQSSRLWAIDSGSGQEKIDQGNNDIAAAYGLDPAAMKSFASYYVREGWMENPALHPKGQVVVSAALSPDSALKRIEHYHDQLRQQGVFYSSATLVGKCEDRPFNVTLARSECAGPYTPDELRGLALLIPHLLSAIALHRRLHRLEALYQASISALEPIPFGIVLLDDAGLVLHGNSAAHRLVHATRLLHLADGKALRAKNAADDSILQSRLHNAIQTGMQKAGVAGSTLRLKALDGTQLQLLISPLPAWSSPFGERSTAAVFLSDPRTLIGSLSRMLQELYGMTPAEARLTEAIVNGLTPQEFADRQHISLHTVRSQFKAAAARVGANRQAELVRIVLTGPAVLRWGETRRNA